MPTLAEYEANYWAPDRAQVLEGLRAQLRPSGPPSDYGQNQDLGWLEANYWEPDRDQVLNQRRSEQAGAPPSPEWANYERDYWAPDREEVLARLRNGGSAEAPTNLDVTLPPGGYHGYDPGGYNGATGGAAGAGGDFNSFWLGSGGRTTADLKARVQEWNASHPNDLVSLGGTKGDKASYRGRVYDAVYAAGSGGLGATWNDITDGGGGSSGGGAVSGVEFGKAPNSTPFEYDPFTSPDPFTFREFEAPTGLTEENDPGYQARLALGLQGVERGAAARGTLLTGGTLKDINQFGQDYASNEFGNVYNRALQTYNTQYGQAANDYNANFQNALNTYKTNFDTSFQPWQANYDQAYKAWLGNFTAANQEFQNNLASQGQRYNQLYGNAQLGLLAAGQQANYLSNYGTNTGNYQTNYGQQAGENTIGAGNANAGASIYSGAAYGGALNTIGNNALIASYYGYTPRTAANPTGSSGTGTVMSGYDPNFLTRTMTTPRTIYS